MNTFWRLPSIFLIFIKTLTVSYCSPFLLYYETYAYVSISMEIDYDFVKVRILSGPFNGVLFPFYCSAMLVQ